MSEPNISGNVTVEGTEKKSVSFERLPTSVIQAMYREMTGKTESMSQFFSDSYILDMESIRQLFYKFDQTLQQYDVKGHSENITITHVKDDKLVYSSFDRFGTYDTSKTSPISSIIIEFDALIKVPKTEKHYNYRLAIRIAPFSLEEFDKVRKGFPVGFPLPQYIMSGPAISASIDYVDYALARNILSTVEDWVKTLKRHKPSLVASALSKSAIMLTYYSGAIGTLVALLACYMFMPDFPNHPSQSISLLANWAFFSIAWVFISRMLYIAGGLFISSRIINLSGASFCLLNAGDCENKENVDKRVLRNERIGIFLFAGVLVNIIINLCSTWIWEHVS